MKVTQNNDTDRRLRQLLRSDLPDVNENPWITRRVVNRLPPQSAIARVSLVQWICYILSAVALVLAIVAGWRYLVTADYFSVYMIAVLLSVPMIFIFCAGVILIPKLAKIVRES